MFNSISTRENCVSTAKKQSYNINYWWTSVKLFAKENKIMKLSTYNFLTSKAIKGVKVGYPLKLSIEKKDVIEAEFNPTFIERLLPKLDWPTVRLAAQVAELEDIEDFPAELPTNIRDNDPLLQKLHHLLLEIDVLAGQLECPETGRVFPISDGIPNMLLNEDEV